MKSSSIGLSLFLWYAASTISYAFVPIRQQTVPSHAAVGRPIEDIDYNSRRAITSSSSKTRVALWPFSVRSASVLDNNNNNNNNNNVVNKTRDDLNYLEGDFMSMSRATIPIIDNPPQENDNAFTAEEIIATSSSSSFSKTRWPLWPFSFKRSVSASDNNSNTNDDDVNQAEDDQDFLEGDFMSMGRATISLIPEQSDDAFIAEDIMAMNSADIGNINANNEEGEGTASFFEGDFMSRKSGAVILNFNIDNNNNITQEERALAAEEEEFADEDFLMATFKPAILCHERDFHRQSTRIQAWDEYVLVSILCTSISYNALQGFELSPEHQGLYLYEVVFRSLIQIVSGFACLSGIYATMVFSLSILYGKTALGLERDPQYDDFLDNTIEVRKKAFRAFSLALFLFAVLVVLVLAEDLPLMVLPPVGFGMVVFLFLGYQDWKKLVDEATPIYLDD